MQGSHKSEDQGRIGDRAGELAIKRRWSAWDCTFAAPNTHNYRLFRIFILSGWFKRRDGLRRRGFGYVDSIPSSLFSGRSSDRFDCPVALRLGDWRYGCRGSVVLPPPRSLHLVHRQLKLGVSNNRFIRRRLAKFLNDLVDCLARGFWHLVVNVEQEEQLEPYEQEEDVLADGVQEELGEDQSDEEVCGPVHPAGNGVGDRAPSLREKFTDEEPRDWTGADRIEDYEHDEADDREIGKELHVGPNLVRVDQLEAEHQTDRGDQHPAQSHVHEGSSAGVIHDEECQDAH